MNVPTQHLMHVNVNVRTLLLMQQTMPSKKASEQTQRQLPADNSRAKPSEKSQRRIARVPKPIVRAGSALLYCFCGEAMSFRADFELLKLRSCTHKMNVPTLHLMHVNMNVPTLLLMQRKIQRY